MTLFEINKEYEALMEQFADVDEDRVVDTETGEILTWQDFDSLFNGLEGKREDKIRAVCLKIKDMEAQALAVKSILDGYKKRYESYTKGAKRLNDYLQFCLNGEKFECPEAVVKYTKSKAVVIDASKYNVIPAEYIKEHELKESDFNKTAIKKALQEGKKIPGCSIEDRVSMKVK